MNHDLWVFLCGLVVGMVVGALAAFLGFAVGAHWL